MTIRLGSTEIGFGRYAGLWALVVLAFAMQGLVHDLLDGHLWPPSTYLRWAAIQWLPWAALAPWIFGLAARRPLHGQQRLRTLGRHLATSIGVTLLALLISAIVSSWFEPGDVFAQFGQFLGKHAATGMLTYWALFAIQQALQQRAENAAREVEASRLATELAQSRLRVLRTQLQPHFLFNTLHAISTLLSEDALTAEDMLLRLSELLRAFLEDYDGQEVTLRQELVLLDLYLGIQQVRFKDRLTTRIYIDPDTLDCAVPSLILQPIVENAIQHGIGERIGADCVEIESRRDGDSLVLEVRNRNSTLEAKRTGESGHGIGLSNTRLRLRELYGDDGDVRLDVTWPEGVACRIRLPYRRLDQGDEGGHGEDAPELAPP